MITWRGLVGMGSINVDTVRGYVEQQERVAETDRPFEALRRIESLQRSYEDASEDVQLRPLMQAYRAAGRPMAEPDLVAPEGAEPVSVERERGRRRKRTSDPEEAFAMPAPLPIDWLPDAPTDSGGLMVGPTESASPASVSIQRDSYDEQADDNGLAVKPGSSTPAALGRKPSDIGAASPVVGQSANDVDCDSVPAQGFGAAPVSAARSAPVPVNRLQGVDPDAPMNESTSQSAPDRTPESASEPMEIRALRKAAALKGHGVEQPHRQAPESAEVPRHAPSHKREPQPQSSVMHVAPQHPEGAPLDSGTLLQYRFRSWHDQPSVSIRLSERNGERTLNATTDSERAEEALQQHSSALLLDAPLQFDDGHFDGERQGTGSSRQGRESDEQ